MFSYKKNKESEFLNEPPVLRYVKLTLLTFVLWIYFIFLVWASVSPFVSSNIKLNFFFGSLPVLFVIAFSVVYFIYRQYFVSSCPNCGKKLFFTNVRDYIRCFKCGRFLKIDFQNKKLIDVERKD